MVKDEVINQVVKSVGKTFDTSKFIALMEKFEVMVDEMTEISKKHQVKGPDSETKSVAMATQAAALYKQIDKARMSAKRPYLDFNNRLDSLVRPVQKDLDAIKKAEKAKCVKYRNALLAKQREAEAKAAQAEKKKLGSLSVKPVMLEPVAKPAEGKVETFTGASVNYKTTMVPHLVDIKKVPEEYLLVDWVKVRKVVKAGVHNIPGFEIKEEIDANIRS